MASIEYREDDDPDTSPNGTKGARRRAFETPKAGDVLVWRGLKDVGPGWQPYVIEAEFRDGRPTFTEPYLRFRFLKSDGTFGPTVHCVDLNDRRLVWRDLPSSLEGLSAAKPCAFLFLTEDLEQIAPVLYADGNAGAAGSGPRILEGGTGGTGKWPIGAALSALLKKLVANSKEPLDQVLTEDERRLVAALLGSMP